MDPHELAELRSLAYHRAVARRLRSDPSLVAGALSWIEGSLAGGSAAAPYLRRWKALLEGPREALLQILEEDGEPARVLRSCTPFAGVIDPRERWRIWDEVARGAP